LLEAGRLGIAAMAARGTAARVSARAASTPSVDREDVSRSIFPYHFGAVPFRPAHFKAINFSGLEADSGTNA